MGTETVEKGLGLWVGGGWVVDVVGGGGCRKEGREGREISDA